MELNYLSEVKGELMGKLLVFVKLVHRKLMTLHVHSSSESGNGDDVDGNVNGFNTRPERRSLMVASTYHP